MNAVTNNQNSLLHLIPKEITINILSRLPFRDLISVQKVCRYLKTLSVTESLWKQLLRESFPRTHCVVDRTLSKKETEPSKKQKIDWYEIYKKNYLLNQNINYGQFSRKQVNLCTSDVLSIPFLNADFLYFFDVCEEKIIDARANIIKIVDLKEGSLLRTIRQNQPIFSLTVHAGKIYSGLKDGTILIWDFEEGQKPQVLNADDSSPVSYLDIYEDQLLSRSESGFVRKWDLITGEIIHIEKEMEQPENKELFEFKKKEQIRSIESFKDKLICHGIAGAIKIFHYPSMHLLKELTAEGGITTFKMIGNALVFGTEKGFIEIWNMQKLVLMHQWRPHVSKITHLDILHDGIIISAAHSIWGCGMTEIKISNFVTQKILRETTVYDRLLHLKIKEGTAILSLQKNLIEIWDFNPS